MEDRGPYGKWKERAEVCILNAEVTDWLSLCMFKTAGSLAHDLQESSMGDHSLENLHNPQLSNRKIGSHLHPKFFTEITCLITWS